MLGMRFETTVPVSERVKTFCALDRPSTAVGSYIKLTRTIILELFIKSGDKNLIQIHNLNPHTMILLYQDE
jgi:hypothetical protein